jgi:predicted amidohydrolase
MPWDTKERSLERVLQYIDEAAADGADLVCLPQGCVATEGEAIPGPISQAIGERAKLRNVYVVANITERDGERHFQTSFLCDRAGRLIGKYRQTHRLPDEEFDLGDELAVFPTEWGLIGLKSGSDHYVPEVDRVLAFKNAKLVVWSTQPCPVEDEHPVDASLAGRALDNGIYYVCSRYGGAQPYLTNNHDGRIPGVPLGRSCVLDPTGRVIADTGRAAGVATAAVYAKDIAAVGKGIPDFNRKGIFKMLAEPAEPDAPAEPDQKYARRRIRVGMIDGHVAIDELLQKLDEAGKAGCDIVGCYEFVWIYAKDPEQSERGRQWLARVAEKAKTWKMYVAIAGILDNRERNCGILFDRAGREAGRYQKIFPTHDEHVPGTEVPVFETDFGKLGIRICADEWIPEIDRCYALRGAELLLTPTQSWGPDAAFRERREMARASDNGLWLASITHAQSESAHRSFICDPTGVIVARSEYWRNGLTTAVIDLDNVPARFGRETVKVAVEGYLPEYQTANLPKRHNDWRSVLLGMRRPALYELVATPPRAQ